MMYQIVYVSTHLNGCLKSISFSLLFCGVGSHQISSVYFNSHQEVCCRLQIGRGKPEWADQYSNNQFTNLVMNVCCLVLLGLKVSHRHERILVFCAIKKQTPPPFVFLGLLLDRIS